MSQFFVKTRIFYGDQKYLELNRFLSSFPVRRVAVVADEVVSKLSVTKDIIDNFKGLGTKDVNTKFLTLKGEPTYAQLEQIVPEFKAKKPDILVAVGGGSIIDLVKGIAILLNNPGPATDFRGVDRVLNRSVPLIAVPTTAGTGTEVTATASFIDDASLLKLGINGRNVAPLAGLMEPELLKSCPRDVAISAGLDAMVHAVEAVTAKTATDLTSWLGAKAFATFYSHLPTVLEHPKNVKAWTQLQMGAFWAGIAMMNAGGGPASGISYPLGVHYGVPHGIAGGIFLSDVFRFNVNNGCKLYSKLYEMLPDAVAGLSELEQAMEFVKMFDLFYKKIEAPKNLAKWNFVTDDDVNHITHLTMIQRKENLDLNPVLFGEKEVSLLLKRMISCN